MTLNGTALGALWAVVCSLAMSPAALAQEADAATRVQRDAANPLRMIIEAGKLKVRQKSPEAEPEPPAKPAAPARPPAAKTTASASAAPAARPATSPGAQPVLPPQVLASLPATPPAAPAEDATARLPLAVADAASAPGADSPAVAADPPPAVEAAVPSAPQAQLALAVPALPEAPATPSATRRAALELADYVEPVLNERLRRRLKGDGAVVVEFTVQTDGSVADLAVRSASDRSLETAALDAVRQWRYQPIPAAQPHAVQLVFKLKD